MPHRSPRTIRRARPSVVTRCCAALAALLAFAAGAATDATAQTRTETVERGLVAGRDALDKNRPADALDAFRRVLAADAGNADAALGQAIALDQLGRTPEALALFDQLAVGAPDNPAVRFWRGRAYYRVGRFDDAIRDFTEAAPLDPTNAAAYQLRLGDAFYAKGEPLAALAAYRSAAAARAPSAAAFRGLGNAHYALRQYPEAVAAYGQALSRDPVDGRSALHRAWARQAIGEREGALADLTRAIETLPPSAHLFLSRADLRRQLGERDRALEDYFAALDVAPGDPVALYGAARTLLDLGRVPEAEPLLARLIRVAGDDPARAAAAGFQLGRAKLATGFYDAAEFEFTRSLELSPDDADAHVNRALARLGKGDPARAREDLRAAVRLRPADAAAHYALARAALAAGAGEEALRTFARAETLAREDADGQVARGLTLLAFDRPLGAITAFQTALEKDPTRIDALQRMAGSLLDIGRPSEALELAARLIELAPENPEGHLLEAEARIALAAPQAARAALDRATDRGGDAARIAFFAGDAWLAEARVLGRRGEQAALENAVAAFDTAVVLTERDPRALLKRAIAQQRLGKYEAAKSDLDDAIRAEPSDPELRFARAAVLKQLDRCDQAIRDYDLGLAARPDNSAALAARGRCKMGEGSVFDGVGDMISSWF